MLSAKIQLAIDKLTQELLLNGNYPTVNEIQACGLPSTWKQPTKHILFVAGSMCS